MLENKSPVKKVRQETEDKGSQQQKKHLSQSSLRDFIGSNNTEKQEPVPPLPVQPLQGATQPTKTQSKTDLSAILKKALIPKGDELETQELKLSSGKRVK